MRPRLSEMRPGEKISDRRKRRDVLGSSAVPYTPPLMSMSLNLFNDASLFDAPMSMALNLFDDAFLFDALDEKHIGLATAGLGYK